MNIFGLTQRADGLLPDSPTSPRISFPLTRLVTYVGLGLCLAILILAVGGLAQTIPTWLVMSTLAAMIVGVYLAGCRFAERRWVPFEVAPRRAGGFAWGAGLGVALMALVVGILVATGALKVTGSQGLSLAEWAAILGFTGLFPAVVEEVIFRGVVLRLIDEGFGSIVALTASSLFFGVVHLLKPGADALSTLNVIVGPGLLFGGLYLLTRSLWVLMGLHFAWNTTLAVVGLPVSGVPRHGLWTWEHPGSNLVTGGNFGPEAGLVALLVVGAAATAVLVLVVRRGLLIAPAWRRPVEGRTDEEARTLD